MKVIKLNNGVEMPQVGLGTFLIPDKDLINTIKSAYNLGYRQFDTAWKYKNETTINKALETNGIKREDIFITTKVSASALYYGTYHYGRSSLFNIRNFKSIDRVIEESFENLGTEYIDLFLVHYPYPNFIKLYQALEKFYKQGRIRAIGVSNFLQPHIKTLLDYCDVMPAVNQIEISPLNTQKALINFCQEQNIAVEAMSTFSHFRSVEPRTEITESEIIRPIAKKYSKSIVQIVLRWLLQQNIILIPKTWYLQHLKENLSIFDFQLTEEEMKIIDSMDQGRFLNYNPCGEQRGVPKKYRNCEAFVQWNKENPQRSFWEIITSKCR